MLIELRKLKIIRSLSEETPCYTAEIWIDGAPAFRASNRGQGGADDYRAVGAHTEAEVDSWLKANRAPQTFDGVVLEPSLEQEVVTLMEEAESVTVLRRKLRSNVLTIEAGLVYSYPLKKRPLQSVITGIRNRRPDAEILNGTDDKTLLKAARLLMNGDKTAHR